MQDPCIWLVCFFKLTGNETRFFGFAEFLTALALMALVWTITDARYRFRVRTAPLPMQRLTFGVVVAIGVLTLLTDLWRTEKWYVPEGGLLTPGEWQGVMGAVLLAAFLVWTWFAFVRPPRYSRMTAKRFSNELYGVVLRGQHAELAVIADELWASIPALIEHAPTEGEVEQLDALQASGKVPPLNGYAHDSLQILADPQLVKAIVDSAPRTALELFRQMSERRRYPAGLATFARNFISEAIDNKQSFLYRETHAYESGLLGSLKPLTTTIFSRYEMVEALNSLLDVRFRRSNKWDEDQLKAYGRLIALTMRAYVKDVRVPSPSPVLYRAIEAVTSTTLDTYKLNGLESIGLDNDVEGRLTGAVHIIVDCIAILDTAGKPNIELRSRESNRFVTYTIYDALAEAICELIFHAAGVRGPRYTCWTIQHNTVWSHLFNSNRLSGPAGKAIKHKVRRKLYEDTILDMNRFPNYKAAALMGFCLNVLGHRLIRSDYDRDSYALRRLLVGWLRKNFSRLHATHPAVAEHCLLDDMSYDSARKRILFARPGRLGQKKLRYSYLQLD